MRARILFRGALEHRQRHAFDKVDKLDAVRQCRSAVNLARLYEERRARYVDARTVAARHRRTAPASTRCAAAERGTGERAAVATAVAAIVVGGAGGVGAARHAMRRRWQRVHIARVHAALFDGVRDTTRARLVVNCVHLTQHRLIGVVAQVDNQRNVDARLQSALAPHLKRRLLPHYAVERAVAIDVQTLGQQPLFSHHEQRFVAIHPRLCF